MKIRIVPALANVAENSYARLSREEILVAVPYNSKDLGVYDKHYFDKAEKIIDGYIEYVAPSACVKDAEYRIQPTKYAPEFLHNELVTVIGKECMGYIKIIVNSTSKKYIVPISALVCERLLVGEMWLAPNYPISPSFSSRLIASNGNVMYNLSLSTCKHYSDGAVVQKIITFNDAEGQVYALDDYNIFSVNGKISNGLVSNNEPIFKFVAEIGLIKDGSFRALNNNIVVVDTPYCELDHALFEGNVETAINEYLESKTLELSGVVISGIKSNVKKIEQEMKEEIESLHEGISNCKELIDDHKRDIERLSKAIEQAPLMFNKDTIVKDVCRMLADGWDDIIYDKQSKKIIFSTPVIFCHDINDESNPVLLLGPLFVSLILGEFNSIEIQNSLKDDKVHPHVAEKGRRICWGSSASEIERDIKEFRLHSAMLQIWNWLHKYNIVDVYYSPSNFTRKDSV